ncbi:FlgO family outer membrane protein [Kordia sp.]|uniref:FlgO family outer membrane protein n=1 Tax=Kordia sp. TaxID=1965332 RepID=UPI003B5B8BA1
MKKIIPAITFLILLYTPQIVTGQDSTYDTDMMNLANQTVARLAQKNKLVVAVWFFHSTKGKKTELGDYVGRDFSVHFTNVEKNFEVVDRDHIEQLSAEHQWNEEGFIDSATAKQINKLVAADAIVTGTVDYTLHHLRVRIKIIDTETGKQIAAAIKTVRPDESLKFILSEEYQNREISIPKNRRVIQVEGENDPRTTSEDCERKKTGDYCFQNNTRSTYSAELYDPKNRKRTFGKLILSPGQNGCLFNIPENIYSFEAKIHNEMTTQSPKRGNIRVEKCKSITYIIKD